jgi:hypothetical protein
MAHIQLPRRLTQPYQFFCCHAQICLFFKDFKTQKLCRISKIDRVVIIGYRPMGICL